MRGTPGFLAPETLGFNTTFTGTDSFAIDMWCFGETVYQMLTGEATFESIAGLIQYHSGAMGFPEQALWRAGASYHAFDFIRSLMVGNPLYRLTAPRAQTHPWTGQDAQPQTTLSALTGPTGPASRLTWLPPQMPPWHNGQLTQASGMWTETIPLLPKHPRSSATVRTLDYSPIVSFPFNHYEEFGPGFRPPYDLRPPLVFDKSEYVTPLQFPEPHFRARKTDDHTEPDPTEETRHNTTPAERDFSEAIPPEVQDVSGPEQAEITSPPIQGQSTIQEEEQRSRLELQITSNGKVRAEPDGVLREPIHYYLGKKRTPDSMASKHAKLGNLKEFAAIFKLKTPVPHDLVELLAKDSAQQKAIMSRQQEISSRLLGKREGTERESNSALEGVKGKSLDNGKYSSITNTERPTNSLRMRLYSDLPLPPPLPPADAEEIMSWTAVAGRNREPISD